MKPQSHPNTSNPVGDVRPENDDTDLVHELVLRAREAAQQVTFVLHEDGNPLDRGSNT